MMVILWVFGAAIVLELILQFVPFVWRARKVIAATCLVLTAFASGGIALWHIGVWSVLVAVVGMYRALNYLRIVEGRMNEPYLRSSTRRSGLVLLLLQLLLAAGWWGWQYILPHVTIAWTVIAGLQLAIALLLLASLDRHLRRTAWPLRGEHADGDAVPTVTVAIPARNETDDLQECLRSVVASDYSKLEILVLDDCSQLKRTPEIIRSFAHDGVRFIQGADPGDTWLPRNQAYDRLAQEANGEYVLFCGVDVRFKPESIGELVRLAQRKRKLMVSVLPWRGDDVRPRLILTQAMRYFWELVPPRRLFQRPPVLSTCWIIKKEALQKAGGFAAARRAIVPEAYLARTLLAEDGYSFVRAGERGLIQSLKSPRDQRETAVRTRYPQLHRRPENVAILTLAIAFVVLLPPLLAVGGFWWHMGIATQVLAAVTTGVLAICYALLLTTTRTGPWWFGLIGFCVGVLYDIGLLHYSMWQYEFSVVDWKGRNVCIPTMRVYAQLPRV